MDYGTNNGRSDQGVPVTGWGRTDNVEHLYTGEQRDAETSFDFFRARYYTGRQGRFHSPDPFHAGADLTNPQSWNAYTYVNNDPLTSVDPDGLESCPSPCSSYNPGPSGGGSAGGTVGGSFPGSGFGFSWGGGPKLMASPSNLPYSNPYLESRWNSAPTPKNQTYPKLQKDQCQAIRTLLNREAQLGTILAAFRSSNTFGDGMLAPLNSTFVPNIQTPIGELDVDWFTDLQANGGRYNAFVAYPVAKLGWTALRLATGQSIGNALPWSDPGERTAYGATLPWSSKAYKDIFTPQYMQQACPNF